MESKKVLLDFYLLIPCYNNKEGLLRSLESVTYTPNKFAILIVDDGSDEPVSPSWLEGRIHQETMLEILRLPLNEGITAALNAGLEKIAGYGNAKYVARLDCGDTCSPMRFVKQVNYLDANADIDLVGSWCVFKDPSKTAGYTYKTPTEHEYICKGMYFRNIFIHPTVMWRLSAQEKVSAYPQAFPHAEDYGFFQLLLQKGRGAVMGEVLVTCELNPKGLSLGNRSAQLQSRMKVVQAFGTNKWLTAMGMLKLRLLQLVPYRLVLRLKRLLYEG